MGGGQKLVIGLVGSGSRLAYLHRCGRGLGVKEWPDFRVGKCTCHCCLSEQVIPSHQIAIFKDFYFNMITLK